MRGRVRETHQFGSEQILVGFTHPTSGIEEFRP
jgi:hypothetical protein